MRVAIRSIRFTVFLFYALILLGTFSFFSSILYFYVRHELYNKVDTLLLVKADGLESAIRTYLKTKTIEAPSGWAAFFAGSQAKEDRFSIIADMLTASSLSSTEQDLQTHVNIFDADGKHIASSAAEPVAAALSAETIRGIRRGEKVTHSILVRPKAGMPFRARAVTRPVFAEGKLQSIIQVRAPLQPVEAQLRRIGRLLVGSVFVTLLVASWAGILLVNITLHPVDAMVRKIRNIKSDNLSGRLSLPDSNDEITRLARTFNEMLDRVEKSFEAQRQIVQDISHELKTPLTIMRGQMEVALKHPRTPEEYAALYRESIGEIEKVRRIIDDLLMLARLDARATVQDFREIRIDELLRSVAEDAQALAVRKKITVTYQGASAPLAIEGNDSNLGRLFTNLLDNAVKYTPEGGSVEICAAAVKDGVSVTVRDTGVGIGPEDLPHIFDRFYRAKNVRREGWGLGLSIAKSIVDAHRGSLKAESVPGQGALFSVFLPRHQQSSLFGV